MEVQVWSDVQVNVESARAAALTISAITKASPGVVSYTGTDPVNGDLMLLRVTGIPDLDYLTARVASVDGTANTFALEGVDSTNMKGTFASGTASKLTFGTTADTITDVNWSGGEAADIDIRTIHNSRDRSVPGNFTPLKCATGNLWDPADPALIALRGYSNQKKAVGFEVIFATGAKVYMAAIPSTRLAPGGSAGAAVTTPVNLSVQGDLVAYAS
jgi:hypothetical protein